MERVTCSTCNNETSGSLTANKDLTLLYCEICDKFITKTGLTPMESLLRSDEIDNIIGECLEMLGEKNSEANRQIVYTSLSV